MSVNKSNLLLLRPCLLVYGWVKMIVPPESYKVVNYSCHLSASIKVFRYIFRILKSSEFTKAYCIMPRSQVANKTC